MDEKAQFERLAQVCAHDVLIPLSLLVCQLGGRKLCYSIIISLPVYGEASAVQGDTAVHIMSPKTVKHPLKSQGGGFAWLQVSYLFVSFWSSLSEHRVHNGGCQHKIYAMAHKMSDFISTLDALVLNSVYLSRQLFILLAFGVHCAFLLALNVVLRGLSLLPLKRAPSG